MVQFKTIGVYFCFFIIFYGILDYSSFAKDLDPKTYVLVVGRAKLSDSITQQQRASDAVGFVSRAFRESYPDIEVISMVDPPICLKRLKTFLPEQRVSVQSVRDQLLDLSRKVQPEDTVILYTHTHGIKPGEGMGSGGLVMGLPMIDEDRGVLSWQEYGDLLLAIPAKNVIVLTMACFSGNLVDTLLLEHNRAKWASRSREGRSFVVLTSQNSLLPSSPIKHRSNVINPFTLALLEILSEDAKPIRLGQFVDSILTKTGQFESRDLKLRNTAEPKAAGDYISEIPFL